MRIGNPREIKIHINVPKTALFRTCPKCYGSWTTRGDWILDTEASGTVGRHTLIYANNGRDYRGYYHNVSRAHIGCGGEMWDVGQLWRERRPFGKGDDDGDDGN